MNRYHYIDEQGEISDPLPLAALQKIGLSPSTHVLLEGAKKWVTLGEVSKSGSTPPPVPMQSAAAPIADTLQGNAVVTPAKPSSPQLTTDEKLFVDRYLQRCGTRDRMLADKKLRIVVSSVVGGLGMLTLIGTLAGGEAAVRESLAAQNAGEAGRAMGLPASSDLAKELAGQAMDVTGLTKHEYQSQLGVGFAFMVAGALTWLGWKYLWQSWPFLRARSWAGGVLFLIGLLTGVMELGRGEAGSFAGASIFMGVGVWLFTSGVTKTKAIIGHLTAVAKPA